LNKITYSKNSEYKFNKSLTVGKFSSIFLFVLFLVGCSTVPYTNRTQLMLVSEKTAEQMGNMAFNEVKVETISLNNSKMDSAVNRVGTNISKAADKSEYQWKFLVVESNDANAFCLPGGKVVVYSGLFKYIKNDGELATVLGHEIAHAIARHSGERISQGYVESFGGIAIDTTLAIFGIPGIFGSVYSVAAHLGVNLPFSRTQEYEADYIGLMLMAKAGYDPDTAIVFWKDFSKESDYGSIKEFFTTHPMGKKRIQELKDLLPKAEKIYASNHIKLGVGERISST